MNTIREARRTFALGLEQLEAKQLLSLPGTALGLAGGGSAIAQIDAFQTGSHAQTAAQKGFPADAEITSEKALTLSVTEGKTFSHILAVTFTVANGGHALIAFTAHVDSEFLATDTYFKNLSAVVSPVNAAKEKYAVYLSGTCIALPPVADVDGQLPFVPGLDVSWKAAGHAWWLDDSQRVTVAGNDVPLRPIDDNTPFTTTPGVDTGVIALAGFVDSNPQANFSNTKFQATINWNDPNATAGNPDTVTFIGNQDEPNKNYICCTPDNYEIYSHHTYSEAGKYAVTITVVDDPTKVGGAGKETLTLHATVIVASPPTLYPLSATESGVPGLKFSGPYGPGVAATFTYPELPPNDLSAIINWGDGTPAQTLLVQIAPAPPGGKTNPNLYAVIYTTDYQLQHVYGEYGPYTLTVTIKSNTGKTVVGPLTEQVQVADAPLYSGGAGGNITKKTGLIDGPIATFGPDTEGTASNYTVTINWGDGTITPGTVTRLLPLGANGPGWQISGTHAFNVSGLVFMNWYGSVSIVDKGGQTLTIPATFAYDLFG